MINKIRGRPICLLRVWLQTELEDTKFCYQLIKIMTITKFAGFLKSKHKKFPEFFASSEEKKTVEARAWWRVLSY